MCVNVILEVTNSRLTPAPPQDVQVIVEQIRILSGAGEAQDYKDSLSKYKPILIFQYGIFSSKCS